jgi:AcrR family transcriptional regulator
MARHTAEDTRADLLDAASELFAEIGFRATSIAEVAKLAGYSKATVLYHFSSKERLIVAWADDLLQSLSELDKSISAATSPDAAQDVAVRGFARLAIDHKNKVHLLQAEIPFLLANSGMADLADAEGRLRRALCAGDQSPHAVGAAYVVIAGVAATASRIPLDDPDEAAELLSAIAFRTLGRAPADAA